MPPMAEGGILNDPRRLSRNEPEVSNHNVGSPTPEASVTVRMREPLLGWHIRSAASTLGHALRPSELLLSGAVPMPRVTSTECNKRMKVSQPPCFLILFLSLLLKGRSAY